MKLWICCWLAVSSIGCLMGSALGNDTKQNARLNAQLSRWIDDGGVTVSINDKVVFRYEKGTPSYVPASIIKMATALVALKQLGKDYRFQTQIYRHHQNLYVLAGGDPLLTSEAWNAIAGSLAQKNTVPRQWQQLILDDSRFAQSTVDGQGKSLNPYDAALGGLISNFNTINIRVLGNGQIRSAERQTPTLPIMQLLGKGLSKGKHRISITARKNHTLRHSAELALAHFNQHGMTFKQGWQQGVLPPDATLIHTQPSLQDLASTIQSMMRHSNNIIANQLVLQLSLKKLEHQAQQQPSPQHKKLASLEDGINIIKTQLAAIPIQGAITLVEGSGLSRKNRVELTPMRQMVEQFHPWRHLLRSYGKPPLLARAKTGTLTGVYTLGGFLPAPAGERRTFVIMLNQKRRNVWQIFNVLLKKYGHRGGTP